MVLGMSTRAASALLALWEAERRRLRSRALSSDRVSATALTLFSGSCRPRHLKAAYPNYYADTREFMADLDMILKVEGCFRGHFEQRAVHAPSQASGLRKRYARRRTETGPAKAS